MEGHETFLMAVQHLTDFHAPGARAGRARARRDRPVRLPPGQRAHPRLRPERLGLARERVFDAIAELGNTSAASVPLALSEAVRAGRLQPGSRGRARRRRAGLVWGATVLEWAPGERRRRDRLGCPVSAEASANGREGLRARHRRLARDRRGDRLRARCRRWPVAVNFRAGQAAARRSSPRSTTPAGALSPSADVTSQVQLDASSSA